MAELLYSPGRDALAFFGTDERVNALRNGRLRAFDDNWAWGIAPV